jgi:hypothetical protein
MRGEEGRMAEVMEIVRFAMVGGADPRESAPGMDRWLAAQPGFVSRVLLGPDEEGRYTDLVRWSSLAEAHAAMERSQRDPELAALFAAIDPGAVEVIHLPVLR